MSIPSRVFSCNGSPETELVKSGLARRHCDAAIHNIARLAALGVAIRISMVLPLARVARERGRAGLRMAETTCDL